MGDYTSMYGEPAVFPKVIGLNYEGILQCVARVQNNSDVQPTVSKDHYLKVIGGSLNLQEGLVYMNNNLNIDLSRVSIVLFLLFSSCMARRL